MVKGLVLVFFIRKDLSFDEWIVVKLRFGMEKYLQYCIEIPFTKLIVLKFTDNFRALYLKITSVKLYCLIFTGDFNAHSVQW